MINKKIKKAFTLIELVVVIAVIAILSAVSVVSYVSVTKRAKESKALVEARQAWTEVTSEYFTYNDFVNSGNEAYGWRYDYLDDIAKFNVGTECTVTYDGKNFKIIEFDVSSKREFGSIEQSTVDFSSLQLTSKPYGLKLSYYSNAYSRGFAWATEPSTTDSKLYVVKSNKGEQADFSSSTLITGEVDTSSSNVTTHKAYVNNLLPSTTYSYKVGGDTGWEYGVFRTEAQNQEKITAIQISDAQTRNPDLLNIWENSFAQALETAGRETDFILYNGDQYDNTMLGASNSLDKSIRYSASVETIRPYLVSLPYMSSSGNHEAAASNVYKKNNAIDFAGSSSNGAYYSYDYGSAHFVVLNTNEASISIKENDLVYQDLVDGDDTFSVNSLYANQAQWLVNDLKQASKTSKWILVMMHLGLHSNGDHSGDVQAKTVNATFAPIFSKYHVDLVMQAHDHTFCKTLPYRWNTTGHTTSLDDTTVVNRFVETTTFEGRSYDVNPKGTYYVTTGAAGHRFGKDESDAGIWADVNHTTGERVCADTIEGKKYSYLNNYYKTIVGRITQANTYESFDADVKGNIYHIDQTFNVGDYASTNINANMFGVLKINGDKLTYDFYTVRGNEVKLFDTLNVMKSL